MGREVFYFEYQILGTLLADTPRFAVLDVDVVETGMARRKKYHDEYIGMCIMSGEGNIKRNLVIVIYILDAFHLINFRHENKKRK